MGIVLNPCYRHSHTLNITLMCSNKENLRNEPQISLYYPYSQSRLPQSTDKMEKKEMLLINIL